MKGRVNEKGIAIFTGASVDLAPSKVVGPNSFTGEFVCVKSPLSNDLACLPFANIRLELPEMGVVNTKAAVLEKSVNMDHYLMENQTQLIIDQKEIEPQQINAVVTRSKTAKLQEERRETKTRRGKEEISAEIATIDAYELPEADAENPVGVWIGQIHSKHSLKQPPLEIYEASCQVKAPLGYIKVSREVFKDT
ncbi:hypothetical protein AVEN_93018-1 [Araneus ventricosus]|uniref:Uncharacterized protein n=1 Tax=Araneus ventricosus TaxID=182803 RepID=A0A4Y2WH79_ARAVE|nr:hypothetical protein AVEN_93018-1 [Araneus ventricosus]